MAVKEQVKGFFRSPLTKSILVGGIGSGVSGVFGLFDKLFDIAQAIVSASTGPLIIGGVYVVAIFGLALLFFYRDRVRRSAEQLRARHMEPVGSLFSSMLNAAEVEMSNVDYTVELTDDMSVKTTHEFNLAAVDREVFAWPHERNSDGVPCHDAAELKLTADVIGKSDRRIEVVQGIDSLTRKCYLLFFSDPLRPNDTDKERIRIEGQWPKSARQLKNVGTTDDNMLEVNDRARPPVDVIRVTVKCPANGNRYEVDVVGPNPDSTVGVNGNKTEWSRTFRDLDRKDRVTVRIKRVA